MAQKRGRPPTPLDPTTSHGARLGYVLRTCRQDKELTLENLADLIGFTPQRISDVERAKATPSQQFLAACEDALDDAAGKLLPLLPDVQRERDDARQARADARRAARQTEAESALPCDAATHSEVAGDDVEPTTRLGLLEAGVAAALGAATIGPAPVSARRVDPWLPAHLTELLTLLGRHGEMFGPRDVLGILQRELGLIAGYRESARGELCTELMRVEARWASAAAWACHHIGDIRGRDTWTGHSLRLAHESSSPDLAAFGRGRLSKHERDARRAVAYAEDALRVHGASAQTRAFCARYAAVGYARSGDAESCERRLHDAYTLLEGTDSTTPPSGHGFSLTHAGTRAAEARCWLAMAPAKAIPLYEDALRDWPREEVQHGGVQRARLARACVAVGEVERAKSEGRKAFAIAQATKSSTIERELQRLVIDLRAASGSSAGSSNPALRRRTMTRANVP